MDVGSSDLHSLGVKGDWRVCAGDRVRCRGLVVVMGSHIQPERRVSAYFVENFFFKLVFYFVSKIRLIIVLIYKFFLA